MPPLRAGRAVYRIKHPGEGTWAHRAAECYGRLCPHHPQVTSGEDRCRQNRGMFLYAFTVNFGNLLASTMGLKA
jgi:hypothetical protein